MNEPDAAGPCALSLESPALKHRDDQYPNRFQDRVPWKIRMLETVKPDVPEQFIGDGLHTTATVAVQGDVVECWVNSYGAVSAICRNGFKLGVKPDEYEVVEWHPDAPKGVVDLEPPMVVAVTNCARCGQDHVALVFSRLKRTSDEHTHWALCPTSVEPILMRVIDVGDAPATKEKIGRGLDIQNRWRKLCPDNRDYCFGFFTGGLDMVNAGFTDSHKDQAHARWALDQLDNAVKQKERRRLNLEWTWTRDLPDESGSYWWWNGDADSAPIHINIEHSGTTGDYFASMGQYGWTEARDCKDMAGWWKRLPEPALPNEKERGGE